LWPRECFELFKKWPLWKEKVAFQPSEIKAIFIISSFTNLWTI